MDRVHAITSFVRSVDAGSFSRAADGLGLSPSAVSRAVARLEERLGVRLLNRTTHSLGLTGEGRLLYERAVRVLSELDEAESAVKDLSGTPRGRLRVDAPIALGRLYVAPLIGPFLERYPEIELDFSCSDRFTDLIDEGVDVAVRTGQGRDTTLIARKLAPNRLITCAAPAYFERRGTPATPQELARHDCLPIALQGYSFEPEWRFAADGRRGERRVAIGPSHIRINNAEALVEVALAGCGVVQLAAYLVAPHVRAGRLVEVLPDHATEFAPVVAVYPPARHISPKVRVFVDFLSQHFSPTPPWEQAK